MLCKFETGRVTLFTFVTARIFLLVVLMFYIQKIQHTVVPICCVLPVFIQYQAKYRSTVKYSSSNLRGGKEHTLPRRFFTLVTRGPAPIITQQRKHYMLPPVLNSSNNLLAIGTIQQYRNYCCKFKIHSIFEYMESIQ